MAKKKTGAAAHIAQAHKLRLYVQAVAHMANGMTATQAAEKIGVNRSTLYAWRRDPVFLALHQEVCDDALHFVRAELRLMGEDAVKALRDCLSSIQDEDTRETNKVRRQAAVNVLQVMGAFDKGDPLERLDDDKLRALVEELEAMREVDGEGAVH